jgi:hypothetical protein
MHVTQVGQRVLLLSATMSAPIIDCDLLESSKENIQPLPAGRRVTALSALLSTPHAQREAQHQSIKARHRLNIHLALQHDDDDDDPLGAYTAFVNWTLEAYPQGQSAESGLLELLEEATRVLKDDRGGRWRVELRYLKLWVLYAGYVEKPGVVYMFLLANDIGTAWALLYEEYAGVLERSGRRTDADEIYILGIARNAQPLDRLKNKHREFQKRMMTSTTSSLPTSTPAPTSTSKRTVLGSTTAPTHEDVFTAPSSAPTPPPNARLQIYVDPAPSLPHSRSLVPETDPTPYPDLGTRKTRIKENIPEVKKAGGSTLKSKSGGKRVVSGGSTTTTSKIAVFRDEEMGPPPTPVGMETPARKVVPFASVMGGAAAGAVGFTPFRDEVCFFPLPLFPFIPLTSFISPSEIFSFSFSFSSEILFIQPTTRSAPPSPSTQVPDSVMKPKLKAGGVDAGTGKGVVTSKAEALRKDPLKNYVGASEVGVGEQ